MLRAARKIVLPKLTKSVVAEATEQRAIAIRIRTQNGDAFTYHILPVWDEVNQKRNDGKAIWSQSHYSKFPIVIGQDGCPWYEANLWLLETIENRYRPNMLTFWSNAEDLAAYYRFIETEHISWLDFPTHKLRRPTYRYSGHLRLQMEAGEISPNVAKRRMATVVRFYRWLIGDQAFHPNSAPWVESARVMTWASAFGRQSSHIVKTTDLSIPAPSNEDPWSDRISDGGRLRPLPMPEQELLISILGDIGNPEMTLIHLLSLLTGARIQTVLTIQKHHVSIDPKDLVGSTYRLTCGPGSGIDTKRSKQGVLHIPHWFYAQLHVYAGSARAARREEKSHTSDHEPQLLFLSQRGSPMYQTRKSRLDHAHADENRYIKAGQSVRQFIAERLLPAMRQRLGNSAYTFRFHDLRATFAMNWLEYQSSLDPDRRTPPSLRLLDLKELLWHSSTEQTERYLKFRERNAQFMKAEEGWHNHLHKLAAGSIYEKKSKSPIANY
jgi:integrase